MGNSQSAKHEAKISFEYDASGKIAATVVNGNHGYSSGKKVNETKGGKREKFDRNVTIDPTHLKPKEVKGYII